MIREYATITIPVEIHQSEFPAADGFHLRMPSRLSRFFDRVSAFESMEEFISYLEWYGIGVELADDPDGASTQLHTDLAREEEQQEHPDYRG